MHLRFKTLLLVNDVQLIKDCKQGNVRAQQILFEKFSDRFLRLAMRYVRDQPEAEDIVMMTFIKIFKNIGTFAGENENQLEAWMRKIVINESLMSLRKRNNFNLTETLDPDKSHGNIQALQEIEPEELYQMIMELPAGYRTVFNLYVVEGYDHREISEMLHISESTSRSQLFKAKELLRRKIKSEGMSYGT